MVIFKRNVEKSYKIVEISGNPKDVRKYLGVNKLCDLNTINFICKEYKTLFAIREVTTYDNLFGIRKSVETPFIPKFYDYEDSPIATLKKLYMNHNNTFYKLTAIGKHADAYYYYVSTWCINTYAFTTRDDASKALETYFHEIEKNRADEIAEQELNNREFKIYGEDVLK